MKKRILPKLPPEVFELQHSIEDLKRAAAKNLREYQHALAIREILLACAINVAVALAILALR